MRELKIDFIIHWVWAVIFSLLLITGLTLMGPKFGWFMNYQVPLADYLHRTLAAAWLILTFLAMAIEAYRLSKHKIIPMPWHIIKKSGMGLFVLISTLLFTLSGIFLWLCKEFSHTLIAFAMVIHDLLTLVSVPVIIWHIYDKAYGLPADLGANRNV